MNLNETISEYLHNWYGALPFSALHKVHDLEPDYLYTFKTSYYEDILNNLKDEWYELDLTDKIMLHDTHYEEYKEYTKHTKLI
jgi:hypothetical protein